MEERPVQAVAVLDQSVLAELLSNDIIAGGPRFGVPILRESL